MAMRHTPYTLRMSALTLTATLVASVGCASSRTTIDDENRTPSARSTPALTAELASLWASPAATETTMVISEQAGPSLVAGDWLAWQCAMTGGYFEMTPQKFALMIDQD